MTLPCRSWNEILSATGMMSSILRAHCLWILRLLAQRYEEELKPILGNPERESLTLRLWIEAIEEERAS